MNLSRTILSSAARTVSPTVALEQAAGRSFTDGISNPDGSALTLIVDMTAVGTGSITVTVSGVDKASGKSWPILVGAAIITNSTTIYRVGPGLTPAANAVVNDYLPPVFKVSVVANNANAATYSIGAHVVST